MISLALLVLFLRLLLVWTIIELLPLKIGILMMTTICRMINLLHRAGVLAL
jgi:hypothetical protein